MVGFAGVILSLFANACLTRRQYEMEQARHRKVVGTGLHEELSEFSGMVERNLEHIHSIKGNDRGDLNIPCVLPIVSDHLIQDVGMLERNRAQAALRGVMTAHEMNRKLVLLADGMSDDYIRVKREKTACLTAAYQCALPGLRKAVEATAPNERQ